MTTPYQKKFRNGAVLCVTETSAFFVKGELLKLARDDASDNPYFESLSTGEIHCIFLSRLREATEAEIATLNQSTKASEEENEMTPFQKAGYTKDTVFVRNDGRRIQLRDDDDSHCPFFNYAGTTDYAGVEYLTDLVVFEDKEKDAPVEESVLLSTEDSLEGLTFMIQDTRAELVRLEALLKEKSAELGITIVVGARPSAEALVEARPVELIDTARKAWTLNRRDAVRVSAKEGEGLCLLDNYGFQEDVTYFVNRTDEDDSVHPVLLETEDRNIMSWVPIERMNLQKVS